MASSPITSWQIELETMETVTDFIFLGSKITADGDCSHEIKRCVLLGRKALTNLNRILISRNIILPTKVQLVKALVFPLVTYGCESWTIKKAECRRIDAFELWCWRRLLRVPWTASWRRAQQFRTGVTGHVIIDLGHHQSASSTSTQQAPARFTLHHHSPIERHLKGSKRPPPFLYPSLKAGALFLFIASLFVFFLILLVFFVLFLFLWFALKIKGGSGQTARAGHPPITNSPIDWTSWQIAKKVNLQDFYICNVINQRCLKALRKTMKGTCHSTMISKLLVAQINVLLRCIEFEVYWVLHKYDLASNQARLCK